VCKKIYVREQAGQRHVDTQDCFKYQDMFNNTLVEPLLFSMFQQAQVIDAHGRYAVTLSRFKKSSMYSIFAKFWLFCFKNNMNSLHILHFFHYLIDESYKKFNSFEGKKQFVSAIISNGTNESSLVGYRIACAGGLCSKAMSRDFYDKNQDTLGVDVTFTIRSLERGEITHEELFKEIDFDEFIDKLSMAEQNRLGTFLEKI